MNRMSPVKRATILTLLVEGMSMRSIMRATGVSYNGISKLLKDAGSAAYDYHNNNVRDIDAGHVQVDELWSYGLPHRGTIKVHLT